MSPLIRRPLDPSQLIPQGLEPNSMTSRATRSSTSGASSSTNTPKPSPAGPAARIPAILEQNAKRQSKITLTEIARLCGTSRNPLNQTLKNRTGTTSFRQALLKRRLEIARGLLEKGRLNRTELALGSGYNDSNYFSRAFRKADGHPSSVLVCPT